MAKKLDTNAPNFQSYRHYMNMITTNFNSKTINPDVSHEEYVGFEEVFMFLKQHYIFEMIDDLNLTFECTDIMNYLSFAYAQDEKCDFEHELIKYIEENA